MPLLAFPSCADDLDVRRTIGRRLLARGKPPRCDQVFSSDEVVQRLVTVLYMTTTFGLLFLVRTRLDYSERFVRIESLQPLS